MKSLKQLLLAALVAGTTQIASALPYTAGDLLLVFRDATTNNRPNVEFNLGPVGNFLDQPAGVPIAVGFDTNAVYTNAFSSSLANVKFSAVAATTSGASQPRLWLTDANLVTAPSDYTVSKFSVVRSKVDAVGVQHGAITGTNNIPLLISPTAVGSYSYIVSPGNSAAVGTLGGDAGFTVDAVNGVSLAFYQIVASAVTPKPLAIKVGTFDYATDGTVTFTPVAVTPVLTSASLALQTAALNVGDSKTFTVTADGACGYQWYKNGVAIGGATSSSYTVASLGAADLGDYTVVASNCVYGTTATSAVAQLNVNAPSIVTPPAGLSVARGAAATLSVVANNAFSYQWYLNGTAIGGATGASYNIPAAGFANLGNYTVTVSNPAGSVTSSPALLKFTGATAYLPGDLQLIFRDGTTNNRPNVEINLGTVSNYLNLAAGTVVPVVYNTNAVYTNAFGGLLTNVKFAVAAANSSMLWLSDANLVTTPLDPTVSKFSVQRGKIDNAGVQAAAITLGVNPLVIAPTAVSSWSSIVSPGNSAAVGTLGGDAAFTVDAANGNSLDLYQVVPSAATPKPASTKIGRFTYAADGSVTFTASAVTPVITSPTLASQTITVPSSATFSVTADGASSYQWYRNGAVIPGATASSYTASGARFADNGSYFSVVVSNAIYGTSATSGNATLTVIDPNPFTTQPASVSVKATSNATFTVVVPGAPLTYQWKQNGTNAPFPTAQSATLTVTNTKTAWNGYLYSVIVSNSLGQSVTSAVATLGVTATGLPITIKTPPAALTKLQGQVATFSVMASGAAPFTNLTYQWQFNGGNIAGATASSYTINSVNTSDAGNYSVVVGNAVGALTSANALLTVNLDSTKPVVTLTSPATKFETNVASLVISGTATDNARVSDVQVQVGSGAFASATVVNPAPGVATWSKVITLATGYNTVTVKAVDFAGNNSTPASATYFRQVIAAFNVVTNTDGAGTVTIMPVELTASNHYIGRTYYVTAVPGATSLLSNIVNAATSGTTVTTCATPLKGTKSLPVLAEAANTVTINFVTNRFINAAGTYNGLFSVAGAVAKETAGYITLKPTAKLGYSGKMTLDGDIVKVAGTFDVGGTSTTTVVRSNKSTLTVSLTLGFDDSLSGTVAATGWSAALEADKAVFSDPGNPAVNYNGTYTLLLPGEPGASDVPAGDGYAVISVSTAGKVSAAGNLADGDSFKPIASTISKNGYWPLFSRQYGNTNGIVIGWVQFTDHATNSVLIATNMTWIKQASASTYYPAGFTNTGFTAEGSVNYPSVLSFANGTNGTITLQDGNLSSGITNQIGVTLPKGVFQFLGTNNASMKFSYSKGLVKGSFTNAAQGVVTIKGTYLQSTNYQYVGGYFLGTSLSGGLLIK